MRIFQLLLLLYGTSFANPAWLDNINNGKGFMIALIGMTIVFSGLVLISLIIRLLIRFIEDRKKEIKQETAPAALTESELTDEEVMAIATALNLCSIYIEGEKQRLTWEFDQLDQSSWGVTGRAQSLAQKTTISRLKG